MSIKSIDFKPFISTGTGAPGSPSSGTGSFSDILQSINAENPSKEKIETITSYIRMRMNQALLTAMTGGNYASPLSLNLPGAMTAPAAAPAKPQTKSVSVPVSSEILNRAATTFKVDPSLISAVIKAESGGNPKATSPKGAMGLMQLMPGTARDLGVTNAYDPEQNVMGGTKYLKMLLDRYGGNRDMALAAYNWGPGNVEKSHRSMPSETVNYVAKIKKYMGVQQA